MNNTGQELGILIVDDNPDHIRIISWALEQNKNKVHTVLVRDGQTALDFLQSCCPGEEAARPRSAERYFSIAPEGRQLREVALKDDSIERAPGKPDLIFLDLNLPRVDGREVLKYIKSTSAFRRIPVIVFSSSERDEDITTAYELGANTYISKAAVFDEFSQAMDVINRYWGQIAMLPRTDREGTDAIANLHPAD